MRTRPHDAVRLKLRVVRFVLSATFVSSRLEAQGVPDAPVVMPPAQAIEVPPTVFVPTGPTPTTADANVGVQAQFASVSEPPKPVVAGADVFIDLGVLVPTLSYATFQASNAYDPTTGRTGPVAFTGAAAGFGYGAWPDWSARLTLAFWRYFRVGVRAGFGLRDTPIPTNAALAARFDRPGATHQAHYELFPELIFTAQRRFFVFGIATPVGLREFGVTLNTGTPGSSGTSNQFFTQPQVSFDLHFTSGLVIGWYAGADIGVDLASGSAGIGATTGFRFGGRGGLPPY